jgi:hypothetical protein
LGCVVPTYFSAWNFATAQSAKLDARQKALV